MIKAALEYIVAQATCAASKTLGTNIAANIVALPGDNGRVDIRDLEQYSETRTRFRESFETHLIDAFVEYVALHPSGRSSPAFVAPDDMASMIVFDYGDVGMPLHQQHKATLRLQATEPFTALKSVHGRSHTQKSLAEWIEDWAENIEMQDSQSLPLDLDAAVRAVRKVDITSMRKQKSEDGDFKVERGVMELVELDAADAFPSTILFTCTPFHGLGSRTFKIRTSLKTDDRNPQIALRIVRMEAGTEEMANEFRETMETRLSCKVLIGKI